MKKLLMAICFILFLPIGVKAASVKVTLSCPTTANLNTQIKCTVNISTDTILQGLAAKYNLGGRFQYISFVASNGFSIYSSSSNGFAVGNTTGKKGNFAIGTITLKYLAPGSLALTNLDASDSNNISYSPTQASASVRTKSTVNTLSSLSITNGSLSPTFNANNLNYKATVTASSITIKASKTDSLSSISGIGNKAIKYGTNTFNIVVTSESGSKRTYKIVINRPDNRSSINDLKTLSLSSGTINFSAANTNYPVTVNNKDESVMISATLADSKSSFVSGYGPRTVNLSYGENKFEIRVKSESEVVKSYVLTITRPEIVLSSNKNIKSLEITDYPISFKNDIYDYDLEVKNDETDLKFNVNMEDNKAKYEVKNNTDLKQCSTIVLTATSEDGTAQDYNFHIIKANPKVSTTIPNWLNIIIAFVLGFLLARVIKIKKRSI